MQLPVDHIVSSYLNYSVFEKIYLFNVAFPAISQAQSLLARGVINTSHNDIINSTEAMDSNRIYRIPSVYANYVKTYLANLLVSCSVYNMFMKNNTIEIHVLTCAVWIIIKYHCWSIACLNSLCNSLIMNIKFVINLCKPERIGMCKGNVSAY